MPDKAESLEASFLICCVSQLRGLTAKILLWLSLSGDRAHRIALPTFSPSTSAFALGSSVAVVEVVAELGVLALTPRLGTRFPKLAPLVPLLDTDEQS
jgi:hypothetical protein